MGDVNLIPAERRVRRHRKARLYVWTTVCGTYILLLLAGSLTLRAFGSSEGRSLSGRLEAVTEQAEQGNREMLELRRELAEATVALETTRAIHDQPDWSKLFVGLSDQLGGDIVLSRCQLATLTKEDEAIRPNRSVSFWPNAVTSSCSTASVRRRRRYRSLSCGLRVSAHSTWFGSRTVPASPSSVERRWRSVSSAIFRGRQ